MERTIEEILQIRKWVAQLSDDAFLLLRDDKRAESSVKYKEAFVLEKEVADYYIAQNSEPSRSKSCLSVANLALDAGYPDEAVKYASKVIEFNHDPDFVSEAKIIIAHS
jgi:hypothetical protein